jgi:hypothetical protein
LLSRGLGRSLCRVYIAALRLEWIVDALRREDRRLRKKEGRSMLDLVFLALGLGLFAAAWAYTLVAERL